MVVITQEVSLLIRGDVREDKDMLMPPALLQDFKAAVLLTTRELPLLVLEAVV
jgi:hypothetical protein